MSFWVGRICEEFHCTPSVAYREWLTLPAGTIEEILDARAYAQAKRVVAHAKTAKDIPDGELFELASAIELELAGEELREKVAAMEAAEGG